MSRQGKTRLTKWFVQMNAKEKTRAVRELTATVLSRPPKMCNFIEWQDKKVVYKRYASLFFVACVDKEDNELIGKLLLTECKFLFSIGTDSLVCGGAG